MHRSFALSKLRLENLTDKAEKKRQTEFVKRYFDFQFDPVYIEKFTDSPCFELQLRLNIILRDIKVIDKSSYSKFTRNSSGTFAKNLIRQTN